MRSAPLGTANAPTRAVLQCLLAHQTRGIYGLALGAETLLSAGTLHPILSRLEKLGWIDSWWQDVASVEATVPRRRYYRLTVQGDDLVRHAIRSKDRGRGAWIVPWQALAGAT